MAALTIGGNFLIKYVYVPSEDKPADAPSRGIVRRPHSGWPVGGSTSQRSSQELKGMHKPSPSSVEIENVFFAAHGMSIDDALDEWPLP